MRRYLFVFFLGVVAGNVSYAQRDQEQYSYAVRHSKFPFNKTASVKLVSFGIKMFDPDRLDPALLPMKNNIPDLTRVDQVVDLPRVDIDSIADILMNTCYRLTQYESGSAFCYIPRNAILFFDSAGVNFA